MKILLGDDYVLDAMILSIFGHSELTPLTPLTAICLSLLLRDKKGEGEEINNMQMAVSAVRAVSLLCRVNVPM
jgi:hypothetical protein